MKDFYRNWFLASRPWSFVIFLSLPLAIKLFHVMSREIPDDADARTAQLDTAFGILLIASLLAGAWL